MLVFLRQAETLAEALGDRRRLGQVAAFIAYHCTLMGDYHQTIVLAQQTLASAEALGDFSLQVQGNFYLGQAYHSLGDYRRAIDLLRSNVTSLTGELLYKRIHGSSLLSVASRSPLVRCLAELGECVEAISLGEEAVRIAETANHLDMFVTACSCVAAAYLRKGDFSRPIPLLERGLELCRTGVNPRAFAGLAAALGTAYARAGRAGEALPLLAQAVESTVLRQAFRSATPFLWVSEAYLLTGDLEEASQFARRALEHARAHHERGNQAWALWLLGEIVARREPSEVESAVTSFHQALALARELGMRPLQAHCHRGLGTLYARVGRQEPAGTELSAAIALYRAMEMTCWLPQAEAALAQQAASSAPQGPP